MRVTAALLTLIGGVLLAASVSRVVPQGAAGTEAVKISKDVEYGQADGESLKLDLYQPAMPAGAQKFPGIVFLHGGGWSGGDKNEFAGQAKEMAARGYVAISVNYRLTPKYRYPANIDDVQRAVRWLRSHAEEYHLDPDRIGAMGASAGGHLASMLGVLDTRDPGAKPEALSSRVNCVVDYFGRMDLTLPQGGHDYRPDYIGKSLPEGMETYREASPIRHVDSHTVPFLIVHGARDPQVYPDQSQQMLAALDKAGVEASLLLLAGQGHGFGGKGAQQAWTAAKSFLDTHLQPPRSANIR
jgi:acetyl esterase/lipase